MTDKKVFFVLGGPGSGKGTSCSLISENLNFDHVSLGEVIRTYMVENPECTKTLKYHQILAEGKLIPGDEATELLLNYINTKYDETKSGILIDGYPRSVEQLDIYVKTSGKSLYEQEVHLLYINTPDTIMKQRIMGRARDSNDTNVEVVTKRIEKYYESTMPVIEHFKENTELSNRVLELNGLNQLEDNMKIFSEYLKNN